MIIVSGGQTGADRAALDAAIAAGLDYDGWVPRGGWAEDLPDPPGLLTLYPSLRECERRNPAERTFRNVRDSDATLILWPRPGEPLSRGTAVTAAFCRKLGRPHLILDISDPDAASQARAWMERLLVCKRLNVAGPRESQGPGLYDAASALLGDVFACVGTGRSP
jgi:hypothetical protein